MSCILFYRIGYSHVSEASREVANLFKLKYTYPYTVSKVCDSLGLSEIIQVQLS